MDKPVITRTTQKGQRLEVYVGDKVMITATLDGAEIGTDYNIYRLAKPQGEYTWYTCGRVALTAVEAAKIKEAQKIAEEARETKLATNIPGLEMLRAALDDEARYDYEFNRMMDDEYNDGVNPPEPVKVHYKDIAGNYPRAALYIKAESYSDSHHYAKVTAGEKAMKIIEDGEDLAKAENILNNWLPAEAMWD